MLKYAVGRIALICQVNRSPLGQTFAGGGCSAAVGGVQRSNAALTDNVVVEYLIGYLGYIFKYLPVLNEVVVILGGVGYVKVIALASVPLGIYSV